MAVITVTKANFESEVMGSDKPVLLDFWAAWCGPCRMLSPVVEKIAEKYEGKLKVGKVNADEEAELSAAFRVSSIPMLAVINGGKLVNVSVGYRPMEKIEEMLNLDQR